jgi:tRNA-dihydrouridine synthase A
MRVSVAPMMEYTDRHYRYFVRGLVSRTVLYTEMVTTGAILFGDKERFLAHDAVEHPLVLQIGGDDPEACARSVAIAEAYGYDEYNLNVGCPSDKVQQAAFGACLMARPKQVADIVAAMQRETDRPVTVKHRIGIDGRESYEELKAFVETVAAVGARRFIVHARIAVLAGLSPKENRQVPPLRYDDVYRLKADFPELVIEANGHIASVEDAAEHLSHGLDGVMIGRAAYDNPLFLTELEEGIMEAGDDTPGRLPTAGAGEPGSDLFRAAGAVRRMVPYIRAAEAEGINRYNITKHMMGLFHGRPGARRWRRLLGDRTLSDWSTEELIEEALGAVVRPRAA